MSTDYYTLPVPETKWGIENSFDTVFNWEYDEQRGQLVTLYDKGKKKQWDSAVRLDWSQDVDPGSPDNGPDYYIPIFGSDIWERLTAKEQYELRHHMSAWLNSQFLHGEQGALICTAKIVETVPWIDAKYYAATQVMDEARHVEVFAKYLDTKLSGHYPINAHLQMLLDDIIQDSRWDMTYLGMQIMVEGLALAAFGFIHQLTTEPLLKQLLRYVMSDEARHVAFGVLSLQDYYKELNAAELRERQEFAFEAAVRMRDRFLQQEVWERMGIDVKTILPFVMNSPERAGFQAMLFSKIVPNCKKLGLLDAGATDGKPGWLRTKFTELGVIAFEDWADTGEEYAMFQLAEGEVQSA